MKLISVIQNEGRRPATGKPGSAVLVFRHPAEDFERNSKLIVAESEEAIFVRDGIAVGVFDAGSYVLETNNYPWLAGLLRRFTGNIQAFSCRVYFVDRSHNLALAWGTSSPIQMRDPKLRLQTSIQAHGSFTAKITDSKKFLVKLVGNNVESYTTDDLRRDFRSAFAQHIGDAIARHIKDSEREILEVCTERTSIADSLAPVLAPLLDEYGLQLVSFYVAAIDIPENDPNRQKLEDAFASRGVMEVLGDDWDRQQARDILSDLANNPGAGGVAAAGAAAGVGIGVAPVFGEMAVQMFRNSSGAGRQPSGDEARAAARERFGTGAGNASVRCLCGKVNASGARFCSDCGKPLRLACAACGREMAADAKFCSECGARAPQ